jgi:hypothetical protein
MKDKPKFKMGQYVWVVEPGYTYPQYTDMFKQMGFKNWLENLAMPRYTKAKVFAIGKHPAPAHRSTVLYGIVDNSGRQTLVGESGLASCISYRVKETEGVATVDDVVFIQIYQEGHIMSFHERERIVTISDGALLRHKDLLKSCKNIGYCIIRVHNTDTDGYADFEMVTASERRVAFRDMLNDLYLMVDLLHMTCIAPTNKQPTLHAKHSL